MHSSDAVLINGNFCTDFGEKRKFRIYGPVPHPSASDKILLGVKQAGFANVCGKNQCPKRSYKEVTFSKISCLQRPMCTKKNSQQLFIR